MVKLNISKLEIKIFESNWVREPTTAFIKNQVAPFASLYLLKK